MFRPPARLLRSQHPRALQLGISNLAGRRQIFSSAHPSHRSRSWKNTASRWALAFGAVYLYNNSDLFAEEPAYPLPDRAGTQTSDPPTPTLDTVVARRQLLSKPENTATASSVGAKNSTSPVNEEGVPSAPATPQEYEEEAEKEGAFNPETGEINWDCPCLGGMAHGPCGEEFRAAFSCFVYSTDEPKGMDCIDRFKGMQDCFRRHPDVYGAELDDDEEGREQDFADRDDDATAETASKTSLTPSLITVSPTIADSHGTREGEEAIDIRQDHIAAKQERTPDRPPQNLGQKSQSQAQDLVPKAMQDEK